MTTRVATDRWRRIETLFHQASDIDGAAREAFLNQACDGDPELRAELDSLLSSSDHTLVDLKHSVSAEAGRMLDSESATREKIGAYRLIRTLGQGGMGAVYLGARDDDQYERLVAIKVIRGGLTHSPALQLRFRTERQILANLDHPNIARMLDGGITPDGSPYIVMEYIDGVALDSFCDQGKLSLDARLRLFRTLCAAVDYAHSHLVVHRDIKPGNVLVTEDGVPKLLDFGIAKLLDPYQAGRDPAVTRLSQRLLTPDYASPEQLLGQPVSTATDVYALGVLLFELLTGEVPFPSAGKDPMSQSRAICEDQPRQPSDLSQRTRHLPAVEAHAMRGDVDSIILKALRKDPAQRYASASQLLAEVDRHLSGFAVEAADNGVVYRVQKFVRRHRVGVGIAAAIALLVIGFGIGMGLLARRASRDEARARREEEFLASIFEAATPEVSKGGDVTARQLLDQAAGRIDTELGPDPQLRAAMAESIGEAYLALGLYNQAQPLLERAIQLAGQSQGQSSVIYARYLSKLGQNYRLKNDFEHAEPLFRRVVALNEARHGTDSLQYARSLSDLGDCLYWLEKDAEAEQVLRRALAIERPLGDNIQDGTRSYLALVLERKGDYPEAAKLLREATDITARVSGTQSADYLVALHNLAGAQIDMGDLDGALKSDHEVLETRQRIWGPEHPDTAYSLNNLGWIYLEQGQWQQAEPLLRQNLEIARKSSNAAGPRYASAVANWGRLLEQKGDLAGAAAAFDQAQYVLALGGRSQSWASAKILVYQSMLEMDRHNLPEAIELATRAADLQRKLGGDNNPQLGAGLIALGLANLLANNPSASESSFRSALAIRQGEYPPTHPDVLLAEVRLAEALLAENHPDQALAIVQTALTAAMAAPYPQLPWRLAELQVVEALALRKLGQGAEAAPLIAANVATLRDYNHAAVRKYLLDNIAAAPATTQMAENR